mgnify:CR=1 FL=1
MTKGCKTRIPAWYLLPGRTQHLRKSWSEYRQTLFPKSPRAQHWVQHDPYSGPRACKSAGYNPVRHLRWSRYNSGSPPPNRMVTNLKGSKAKKRWSNAKDNGAALVPGVSIVKHVSNLSEPPKNMYIYIIQKLHSPPISPLPALRVQVYSLT